MATEIHDVANGNLKETTEVIFLLISFCIQNMKYFETLQMKIWITEFLALDFKEKV